MPSFKPLDPELIRKALEGHVDILTPEIKKEEAFLRNVSCPMCQGRELNSYVDASHPFSEGKILPNKLMWCTKCEIEFNPYSLFITKASSVPE